MTDVVDTYRGFEITLNRSTLQFEVDTPDEYKLEAANEPGAHERALRTAGFLEEAQA